MRKDLLIKQGETVEIIVPLAYANGDVIEDATGFTARSQLRKFYTSNTYVAFTCNVANTELTLNLTANQSANVEAGAYVYDVELVDPDGEVRRIQEGKIEVTPEVTR
jgi:hypothetical protein